MLPVGNIWFLSSWTPVPGIGLISPNKSKNSYFRQKKADQIWGKRNTRLILKFHVFFCIMWLV